MMQIYRKNHLVQTEAQAKLVLASLADFYQNPKIGKPFPVSDSELIRIYNEDLKWEWSDETQHEYDRRIAREQAEANLLALHQSDLESWKEAKIRPWRNAMLKAWVDETFIKPLLYDLSEAEKEERVDKRQELKEWPGTFKKWVDDAAIEAAKPAAPSYIIE